VGVAELTRKGAIGFEIPDAHATVFAAGSHQVSVRTECQAEDWTIERKLELLGVGFRIPNSDHAVVAGRKKRPSSRTKTNAIHWSAMLMGKKFSARSDGPETHGAVQPRRCQK
jgi:hypothetical protein